MDVIYHVPAKICSFSKNIILSNMMEKFESVQYSAALAVTRTWRGTSREKLYMEFGWESLNLRRWSRRLTLFYKFMNDLTPAYTINPIRAVSTITVLSSQSGCRWANRGKDRKISVCLLSSLPIRME